MTTWRERTLTTAILMVLTNKIGASPSTRKHEENPEEIYRRPWRERTLTTAILMVLTNKIGASPTTREENPEEIYRRLEEAHKKEIREKEAKAHAAGNIHNTSHHSDEYTYEYETIEELATPSTKAPEALSEHNRAGSRKHRKSAKTGSSGEIRQRASAAERSRKKLDSAIVETLQSKKKGEMTSQERELAKRNLLRGKPIKAHWGNSVSKEEPRYVDAASFEKVKGQGHSRGHAHKAPPPPKKDYTYEYETVEREHPKNAEVRQGSGDDADGRGSSAGDEEGGRGKGRDDEYTYEYETVENKTHQGEGGKEGKESEEMTSKEKFDRALADYHAEQDRRHKERHPEEYDDKVKVEGLNIKEIRDDTNETLLNYDEHGNFKWRKEWEHLRVTPPPTTTSTTPRPYLASGEPEEMAAEVGREELQEYRDSDDRSYSNIYDERLQAKLAKAKEEMRRGRTRNPEVQEIMNMIDNMVDTDPPEVTRSFPTTHEVTKSLMDNFRKHMSAIQDSKVGGATESGTTAITSTAPHKMKSTTKRKSAPPTVQPLSTRSLAERAERRDRKLGYKRKLLEMKQRRMKHQDLFLQMRGFEHYTNPPTTEPPGLLYEEDSFDREYFYLKSERAFKRWLKYNKFRFPQLNAQKRSDYEILLRCWDTDIKRARKGIPIVTLYPPPATFEPSGEVHPEYEYVGSHKATTRRTFKDSLEEAFYRRYDELKHNRTFQSLEKIIQDKEGPRYKAPQLDISEFNRKFWNILLKEEHKDYARRNVDKERLNRVQQLRKQHRESIEGVASIYERQRWIRLQIKKQLETKATTLDRRVELDEEGREWFKGVRGITGDLPDEFYLDDKTDLPKHLRWRVELPEKDKKRKIEREKKKERDLLEQGVISTTSDPLEIYKRLFKPLEMPEWRTGLKTTTTPTTTTQVTTETLHWFWKKYSKHFTYDDEGEVAELKQAYKRVPKKYLTQWMATWCPNLTDFYRIPDDYDPPEWQAKREEYIQDRRKKFKTTTEDEISSDESWHTPYPDDYPFTYPTMTITWDYVGPNQTQYFGLLANAKDKVEDRVVLDSDYLAQMWDKTDSKLERFDLPQYQCMRCNQSFMESEELQEHHKEHLKKEKVMEQYLLANGSYTKRRKTVPPNKSYLFYYYSDAENMESGGVFKPDYLQEG